MTIRTRSSGNGLRLLVIILLFLSSCWILHLHASLPGQLVREVLLLRRLVKISLLQWAGGHTHNMLLYWRVDVLKYITLVI